MPDRQALILSYPKSGRTWLRFMVNGYLCRVFGLKTDNVFEAETRLADRFSVLYSHAGSAMMMTRHWWETGPVQVALEPNAPTLWLTRNAAATLRSAYFQATHRIKAFRGTPQAFLRDSRFGAVKLASFYAQMHAMAPQLNDVTVIPYESFRVAPGPWLRQVIEAFSFRLPVEEALIQQVTQESTLDRMKALGLTPAYADTPLAPTDRNDPDSHKARGGDEAIFTDGDLGFIQRVVQDLFPPSLTPTFANLLEPSATPGMAVAS